MTDFREVLDYFYMSVAEEYGDRIDALCVIASFMEFRMKIGYSDFNSIRVYFYRGDELRSDTVIFIMRLEFKKNNFEVCDYRNDKCVFYESFEQALDKIEKLLGGYKGR